MERIKKILAPTDLSEFSKAGVRCALDLAKVSGDVVTVYHVVDGSELPIRTVRLTSFWKKYQHALSSFLRDNFSEFLLFVETREKVELGNPAENIVEEAKKEGANLIVISTQGRTGVSHALIGSVTEKVVRYAPCPVLSIRPEHQAKMEQ
jgi:nucleotide-binding universal stress UspA family protein